MTSRRLSLSALCALALISSPCALAWNSIMVTTGEGSMAAVQISVSSKISFEGEDMIVRYDHGELAVPVEDVRSFDLLSMNHILLGVDGNLADTPRLFSFDGATLCLGEAVSGAAAVFAPDGRKVAECMPGDMLDMSSYAAGVYVVAIDGKSFKFHVR